MQYADMRIDTSVAEHVLQKLGFSAQPEINEVGLTEIYQAWCRNVPFDNIRKRIMAKTGESLSLPGFTPADFFSHWLNYGVGGTCWASHGALFSLLDVMGFPVKMGISTMLSSQPLPGASPGHGTLIVNFGDMPLLVDATMFHNKPLRLEENDSNHKVWGTSTHYRQDYWHINWKPLGRPRVDCRLLELNAAESEFPRRHELSRDASRFNGATLIRLARLDSIIGMVKGEYVTRHANGEETFHPLTYVEQQQLLIEKFNIAEEIAMEIPMDDIMPLS